MAKTIKEKLSEFDDSISSASTRAGRTIKRVENMTKAGVDAEVQALQMTKQSPTQQQYDVRDVEAFQKLAADTRVGVPITQQQVNALIQDTNDNPGSAPLPAT